MVIQIGFKLFMRTILIQLFTDKHTLFYYRLLKIKHKKLIFPKKY